MGLVCIACGGRMERGHFCAELVTAFGPIPSRVECEHEFGALGAVSGSYCIHCGAKLPDPSPSFNDLDRLRPRGWRP